MEGKGKGKGNGKGKGRKMEGKWEGKKKMEDSLRKVGRTDARTLR